MSITQYAPKSADGRVLDNRAASLAVPIRILDLIERLRTGALLDERLTVEISATEIQMSSESLIDLVCIDSRAACDHSLFVALKGARVDGHAYLPQVRSAGAVAALIDAEYALLHGIELAELARGQGFVLIVVRDTLAALQYLAKTYLESIPGLKRIGVTGSNGKTTTKELIFSIVKRVRNVFASPGNLNSVIGLPLAALAVPQDTELAIFEMAMSEKGEMDCLASLVFPDLAIITNVGTAHIGIIGSQDAIAYEKKQIFSRFNGNQTAFVPGFDTYADFLQQDISGTVLRYGESDTPGYEGVEAWDQGQVLLWNGRRIYVRLAGAHNRNDALAAIHIAQVLGINRDEIVAGLESFVPGFGRSEIIQGQITLVQDCYNANPDSMKASVNAFMEMPARGGRHVLILGDMRELGVLSKSMHEEIGGLVAKSSAAVVLLCGTEMLHAWNAAQVGLVSSKESKVLRHFASFEELASVAGTYIRKHDLVLLKASRGMELERLSPLLLGLAFGS